MFNVNPFEILVITLIFLMLFGPEKLPEIAMQLGKFVRDLREASISATAEITRELHRAAADNQEVADDIRSIGDQARRILQSTSEAVHNTVTQVYQDTGVGGSAATATAIPWAAETEVPLEQPAGGSATPPIDPDVAVPGSQSDDGPSGADATDKGIILVDDQRQAQAAGAEEGSGSEP